MVGLRLGLRTAVDIPRPPRLRKRTLRACEATGLLRAVQPAARATALAMLLDSLPLLVGFHQFVAALPVNVLIDKS